MKSREDHQAKTTEGKDLAGAADEREQRGDRQPSHEDHPREDDRRDHGAGKEPQQDLTPGPPALRLVEPELLEGQRPGDGGYEAHEGELQGPDLAHAVGWLVHARKGKHQVEDESHQQHICGDHQRVRTAGVGLQQGGSQHQLQLRPLPTSSRSERVRRPQAENSRLPAF